MNEYNYAGNTGTYDSAKDPDYKKEQRRGPIDYVVYYPVFQEHAGTKTLIGFMQSGYSVGDRFCATRKEAIATLTNSGYTDEEAEEYLSGLGPDKDVLSEEIQNELGVLIRSEKELEELEEAFIPVTDIDSL